MGEITNVTEYQAIAKQKLPKMIYDYYASGAEDEWTLQENREAFARILFRPRILIDVSKIDMATTVLGFKISMPIMIAPSAMQKMAHPDGEYATARAASAAGTIMTLSSWATSSVEEVASTGPGIRFFQLYVYKDRRVVEQLVRRAERAGFKAIALTVDTPRLGRREADIKNRFVLPPFLTLKNFEGLELGKMDQASDSGLASYVAGQIDRTLSWKDVKWLQTITTLPILVKGVITAEDTRLAVENGAAGIIVSNHGARQLDYVPATVTMPGDPAFEPGDRVALPMEDGTAPEMLVTHFVWRYRGRQTLKGVGRNPYLGGTTDGATEKALRRLQNSAESKRIVYYSFTNPAELAVQTVETPAVAIAFTAVEETSAMFLAQLLLDAAPDTGKVLTLTVRYYINDVPVENFAPQQRLETGAHTLALFYPFASVEAGTVTRLSVRLVCAGGTVKIAPYGIKATVTGQGMASETPWDGTLECEETLLPIAIKVRSINV